MTIRRRTTDQDDESRSGVGGAVGVGGVGGASRVGGTGGATESGGLGDLTPTDNEEDDRKNRDKSRARRT